MLKENSYKHMKKSSIPLYEGIAADKVEELEEENGGGVDEEEEEEGGA